ncbi:MAG: polyprenyl synthetase family protein [Bacteroidales bacterium]|nr:polyprenyl synthetase family protein [Bacteroidales bacterium]
MKREDAIAVLGSGWDDFERLVRSTLHSGIQLLDEVNESLLSNAGKQLRPMLLLFVSKALGGISKDSLHLAASVEMLHNATLLHDDVADGSSMRRGQATIAALMGPSAAVLVGDYWLSKAMDLVLEIKHKDEAVTLFSRVLSKLAEGEMLQLEKAETADTTEQDYLRIIYCKTASLFEAACFAGALSVDAPSELCRAAADYGRAVGQAFQIRDDIFDYTDGSEIGKPVGLDLKERKITLPLLGALKDSPEADAMRSKLRDIGGHSEYLAELQAFVRDCGGIEYATSRLNDFVTEALEALRAFPESKEKEILASLAEYIAIRKK